MLKKLVKLGTSGANAAASAPDVVTEILAPWKPLLSSMGVRRRGIYSPSNIWELPTRDCSL
jgi:hypothetical protein